MERSIRLGKDFNVRWSIRKRVDGERQPYELAGKELVLQYRTPYGLKEATQWKVVGNTIVWTFRGKEQKALGSYELILTENGGKDGMVTVDTCRAFKLVAHSCEETEGSGSDIVIEDVVLESEVAFAPIVIEGGGESYDDTEIKNQLAALQQKDAQADAKLAELSEENEVLKEAQQFTDVAIKDLQDMKIDRENDDYYPKMAVGLADNLAGVDVVDSEINFRRSGGGAISDGVARIESIKGNSVVWNQCYGRGSSGAGTWEGNIITINGMYSSEKTTFDTTAYNSLYVDPIIGHKYFVGVDIISGTITGDLTYVVYPAKTYTRWMLSGSNKSYGIITEASTSDYWFVRIYSAGSEFTNLKVRHVVYDLTKKFGSGNEPTTIEEFYARIPMGVDLNAYNEGEVIHMDVQSIESVGVNQWDEEWEVGGIELNGELNMDKTRIRTKNPIRVFPQFKYYAETDGKTIGIRYYDKEGNHLGASSNINTIGSSITTPANAYYMRFSVVGATTYSHDICINLYDDSINGKYYPYIKRVEDLSIIRKYFPQGMKSAGSAHDEIRYNKASGKWEKVVRIGEVDMGTLSYTIGGSGDTLFFYTEVIGKRTNPMNGESSKLLCGVYATGMVAYYSQEKANMTIYESYSSGQGSVVYIKNSAYTDAASFKAAMAGVILYYELAEPIVTELDEADQFKDLDYQVWNAGTEKAIAEDKSAPLAADITYGFNAIGKIKELESLVAALRAKVGI